MTLSRPPHGTVLASPFRAHPLFAHAHLQTLLPSLLRPTPRLALRIERLDTPDGDFVELAWAGEANAGGPIAVLTHGLTGGFESKYLRGCARVLIQRGWRVCLLQLRGGGATVNRSARLYNHGDSADLRYLWHELRRREPHTRLVSLGWSLGGSVTVKALAEEGENAPVAAIAVASIPFQLEPCAERLRHGFSRVYQDRLLRDLNALIARRHQSILVPPGVDVPRAAAARDFFEFDEAYTAPLNGYASARDYYTRCSPGQFLAKLKRPALVVHAGDDPFMEAGIIPAAVQLAPSVTLEVSAQGGHVGFLGIRGLYLEQRLPNWLDSTLDARPSSV